MLFDIPERLAVKRFALAVSHCECCGKLLLQHRQGREHGERSWEPHQAYPNLPINIDNIRILCATGRDCHLNCGHDGDFSNPGKNPMNCRMSKG